MRLVSTTRHYLVHLCQARLVRRWYPCSGIPGPNNNAMHDVLIHACLRVHFRHQGLQVWVDLVIGTSSASIRIALT